MFPNIYSSRGGRFLSGEGFLRRPRRRSSLLNGLIAHWKLDEQSGSRYDSVQNHHLTAHGEVMRVDGVVGYSTQFVPYTGDYLSSASTPDLRMTGTDFTIAGWVFFDSLGEAGLVGKWAEGSLEYLVGSDGMYLYLAASGNGANSGMVTATAELDTGLWFHFVGWYDTGAGALKMTLNNGSISTQSYSNGIFAGLADFALGHELAGGTFLSGRLDSVSIWKRLLSAEERGRLYNGGAGLDFPFA